MLFAVTSPTHNTMYFLLEPAEYRDHVVEAEDVDIDALPLGREPSWPVGTRTPRQVLCRSRSNPKHYKQFKYRDEVDPAEYEDTGKNYGGIFSKERWIEHRKEVDERVRLWDATAEGLAATTDATDTEELWGEVLHNLGVEPSSGAGGPT